MRYLFFIDFHSVKATNIGIKQRKNTRNMISGI